MISDFCPTLSKHNLGDLREGFMSGEGGGGKVGGYLKMLSTNINL